MPPVTVLILAPMLPDGAGHFEQVLDAARTALAEHHRQQFLAAGAAQAVVRREPPDSTPFGARLQRLTGELLPKGPAGLVVLGAGSIPLADARDLADFVAAAAAEMPGALANHRYSADAIAIARADLLLPGLPPELDSDNALPRYLAERALAEGAGVPVADLRRRRHLAMDVDSPLDVLLLAETSVGSVLPVLDAADAEQVRRVMAALRAVAADPGGELLLAGRVSSVDLAWVERNTRSRTRAWIEERGLRTASAGALIGRPNRRPARSVLGELLERDGPGALGRIVASMADGALIDSRVLMAHRFGAAEHGWPVPEDRFASDLLRADLVQDPWLAELTASAAQAPVPVMLGAHSLVGPGVRNALSIRRGHSR
jgi:hypothetical protein